MMIQPKIKEAKILIVDDEKVNVRLIEMMLDNAGYCNLYSTTDAREVLPMFQEIDPSLVLLDLAMPYMDGFEVMHQLQTRVPNFSARILVLTADVTTTARHKALKEGAGDFLTKPFDETEVLLRIQHLLESYFHNVMLEQMVQERTLDLKKSQMEALQRLALAAEYRDDDTGLHTRRVGLLAQRIAHQLSVTREQENIILHASALHDVGKIGIADSILLKPGKLTAEEFEAMKKHTIVGSKILSKSFSPWLKQAGDIALSHHERWDGSGYPLGLSGERIPLVGRIVAVADVFDALTHKRPYKPAWPKAEALEEIKNQSGKQFDPRIVEAFLQVQK